MCVYVILMAKSQSKEIKYKLQEKVRFSIFLIVSFFEIERIKYLMNQALILPCRIYYLLQRSKTPPLQKGFPGYETKLHLIM